MADASGWEQWLIHFMLGVFPWIFFLVGLWFLYSAHKFMKNATRAIGTVIAVHESASMSGSGSDSRVTYTYKPVFEYTDAAGQTQKAETAISSSSYNFPIGDQREILTNAETPGTVRMPGFMVYGFGAIFAVIGLIFGIVGFFALSAM